MDGSRWMAVGLVVAALTCASGCHLIFPFDVSGQEDAGSRDQGAADSVPKSDKAPPPLDSAAVEDRSGPTKIEGGPHKVDASLPVIQWMKLSFSPTLPWSSGVPSIYARSVTEIYVAVGDTLYECEDLGKTLSCLGVPLPPNLPPGYTLRDIGGTGSAVFVAGGPGVFLSKQSGWQNIYTNFKFDFHSVWCNGTSQCYLGAERQEFWPFTATSVLYKGGTFTPEKNNLGIERFQGAWIGPLSFRVLVGAACQIDQLTSQTASWTSETPPGCTTDLHSVWGGSASDVHVVGGGGARLHRYGTTWKVLNPETYGAPALRAVWGFTTLDVYAVGDQGAVWHFDGVGWSLLAQPSLLTKQDLTDLWGFVANSKRTLYAIGEGGAVLRFKE